MADERALWVVVDEVDDELVNQLSAAATARNVRLLTVDAGTVDLLQLPQLGTRDLLYRIGGSHRACVAEQLLWGPGVATFYADSLGPHRLLDTQELVLARAGVPVPRATYALPANRAELRFAVDELGGLPIVIKRPGSSLGLGVMRLDTWTSLVGVVDALRAEGGDAFTLMAYVAPAVHWRVIVVADEVVACYRNPTRDGDFRTEVHEENTADFSAPVPAIAADAARAATTALGLRCAGVDVLVHEGGSVVVLEANFPFYFGHPKRAGGPDVALRMVDALLAFSPPSSQTHDDVPGGGASSCLGSHDVGPE